MVFVFDVTKNLYDRGFFLGYYIHKIYILNLFKIKISKCASSDTLRSNNNNMFKLYSFLSSYIKKLLYVLQYIDPTRSNDSSTPYILLTRCEFIRNFKYCYKGSLALQYILMTQMILEIFNILVYYSLFTFVLWMYVG